MSDQIIKVGFDLDNTVADYLAGVTPLIEKHYGLKPINTENPGSIEGVFGLQPGERLEGWRDLLYHELRVFRFLPKLEPDVEMLSQLLAEDGFEVWAVTARPDTPTIVEDTAAWLRENGFVVHGIAHVSDKAQFCSSLGISVLYEDEPRFITGLEEAGIPTVIRHQPWNKHLADEGLKIRAHSWMQAYIHIKQLVLGGFCCG